MDDERVHLSCLGAKSSNTVAALFRGAELELEERIVARSNDAEVVGHDYDITYEVFVKSTAI